MCVLGMRHPHVRRRRARRGGCSRGVPAPAAVQIVVSFGWSFTRNLSMGAMTAGHFGCSCMVYTVRCAACFHIAHYTRYYSPLQRHAAYYTASCRSSRLAIDSNRGSHMRVSSDTRVSHPICHPAAVGSHISATPHPAGAAESFRWAVEYAEISLRDARDCPSDGASRQAGLTRCAAGHCPHWGKPATLRDTAHTGKLATLRKLPTLGTFHRRCVAHVLCLA